MLWSKLKKRVETLFSPSLKGRVELRITNYRKSYDWEGRAWITIDKEEICNFCTWKYLVERGKLTKELQGSDEATNWRDPAQVNAYYSAQDTAERVLEEQRVVSQGFFEQALETYLQLSINEALASENFIHRVLVVLDRRVGKRRLSRFKPIADEHPVVERLLELRLSVEGINRHHVSQSPNHL